MYLIFLTETPLLTKQEGHGQQENSLMSSGSLKASANVAKIETQMSTQPGEADVQITSSASEIVSPETKPEKTLSTKAGMDTYEEISKSEVTALDDWEKVHKSCLSEIPPVDPEVLRDLELKASIIAGNLDHMLSMLTNSLKAMSHVSVECLGVYSDCVDHVSVSVDENIKSMYTLIARCEELNASLKPVQSMAEEVKEIKKSLDIFEAICK